MKEHLIYTAGLIDGEGTITLSKTNASDKYRHPVVSVTSTSYELLEFLKDNFGGHISVQKVYKETHKQSWSWAVSNDAAIKMIEQIYPFIKEKRKGNRAKMIIEQYKKLTVRNGKYTETQKQSKLDFETAFLSS